MRCRLLTFAAGVFASAFAHELSAGAVSDSFMAFLRPEASSFWRTASGREVTVPVDFPEGAVTATLTVRGTGSGYVKVHSGITSESYAFELPAATDCGSEDVYELALAFDDEPQTVRTAKIALIRGLEQGASGRTRCLSPEGSLMWRKGGSGRAVLPVPYGVTAFLTNGVVADTGLDGAQGWYVLKGLSARKPTELTLEADGVRYDASLLSSGGMLFLVR